MWDSVPMRTSRKSLCSSLGRGVGIGFSLLALLAASVAFASEDRKPVREAIDLRAGATCLDGDTLAEHVRTWLGTDTVERELAVEVRGSSDSPRMLEFRTRRGGEVRAYRRFGPGPERCDDLQAAVGLAIAMAIRASLVDELSGSVASGRAREAAPGRRQPWTIAVDAVASLDVLPGPAFGFGVRVERTLTEPFDLRIGLLGLGAPGETFDTTSGHFDVELLAFRLDLGADFDLSHRLRCRPSMGFAAGGLAAQGHA